MASELAPVPRDLAFDATIRALDSRQQVFGRYVLRRILGRGGMGVVWLGFDERLERDVALKFLPEDVYFDPGALDELKRETRRCLELTHPNIIRIYDFAKDEQAAAISMEYIDGQTLAGLRIEKDLRIFEVDEIKSWMVKACQALHYAHEEVGVVHRDLKPANFMLTSRGQIKIADFGIAQSMGESMSRITMRRGTSGTLAYMSPQQLNGDTPRATDDIYAMGTTIYEMLTSKPPFYSGDIPFQVRVTMPRTMKERRCELGIEGHAIPEHWESAVAACLAKIPAERPKSMLELSERLGFNGGSLNLSVPRMLAVEVRPVARIPKPPPPLPRARFPKRRVLHLSALILSVALLLWFLGSFIHTYFFSKPGSLMLTTNPLGALVHLAGYSDSVTPASFPSLSAGHHKIRVTAESYDPFEEDINIAEGGKMDLGTIQLQRSFGSLSLAAVPLHAHYRLVGGVSTANFQKEGSTPDFLAKLPAGTYQLTLDAPNFPSYRGTVEVPAHGTGSEAADLTQRAIANIASAEPAKVIRGEMDAMQLDASAKNELIALYNKAFEAYFASGLLGSASEQLAKIKSLGANIESQQARLAEKRAAAENVFAGSIQSLIASGKFATAAERFKNLNGALDQDSIDRLISEFQVPLTQYQQEIQSAIKAIQNQPVSSGYVQLKTLVHQHPDDLNLEMAVAGMQTQMPPDHEFLVNQIAAFQQFNRGNPDFVSEPALIKSEALFTEELRQLDALTAALAAAKNGPSKIRSQIANLENRESIIESRRVGRPKGNPFSQTINFFGKAVTGHTVVDNAAYFSSAREKREALEDVQAEIVKARAALAQPQGSAAEAQTNYDQFVEHVPWGQETDDAAIIGSTAPPIAPAQDNPAKL